MDTHNTSILSDLVRPKSLNDFFISHSVRDIVSKLIESNRLNVIFIGGGGVGKSTMMQVIVETYYKGLEPIQYTDNLQRITILNEHGINFYRTEMDLFCQTASCVKGKKKMVIIDDVDCISEQNQHVFKNCIEKYDKNVLFLMSCTNMHRVVDGIQSRFLTCKISLPTTENMYKIVHKIQNITNILMDKESEKFIVDISNRNIHTLINCMEKIRLYGRPVTHDVVLDMCTDINFKLFEVYITHLKTHELHMAIMVVYNMFDCGYSVMDILGSFFKYVKSSECLTENEKYAILPIICKYIAIFYNIHEDKIELAFFTNGLYQLNLKNI